MEPGLAAARSILANHSRKAASLRRLGALKAYQSPFSPVRIQTAKKPIERFRSHIPRLILHRRKGAKKYKRGGSRGIGSSKHQAHGAAFRPPINGRSIRTSRIHHSAHVANSFFDRLFGDAIRKPLAALVENNYSCESGEPLKRMLIARYLPQQFNVRDGTRYQHNVAGAVAKNAVRDGNIATAGVLDRAFHLTLHFEKHRPASLWLAPAWLLL